MNAQQVEQEYGMPFWDVVKLYADDGESINATALILGYKRPDPLYRKVKAKGVEHWFKRGFDSNGARLAQSVKAASAEHQIALRKYAERKWHIEFNGVRDSISGHARRIGIARETVFSRLRTGWTLEQALSTPKSTPRRYSVTSDSHPWREGYEIRNDSGIRAR
jgi:hypothetical protein